MAIRHAESFEFDLTLDEVNVVKDVVTVTMDRDAASQLCRDLMTALGIRFGTYMPHDDLDDEQTNPFHPDYNEAPRHPATMSPEEAAARAQILAQQAEAASHAEMQQRRRGNAIGSGPMH